jgi:hypothetical protein
VSLKHHPEIIIGNFELIDANRSAVYGVNNQEAYVIFTKNPWNIASMAVIT